MNATEPHTRPGTGIFPKGPPDTPLMNGLSEQVRQLILADGRAARERILGNLTRTVRETDDPILLGRQELTDAGEALISSARDFIDQRGDRRGPAVFGGGPLRSALGRLQSAYAAELADPAAKRAQEPEPEREPAFG